MTVKVSVIVPTYNRVSILRRALNSLVHQLDENEHEIIVVDNGENQSLAVIDECLGLSKVHNICYIHEPRNGLHHARHAGALVAKGEILVYIDDDVICPENWLQEILKPFEDEAVGFVGGKTIPMLQKELPQWIEPFQSYLSILDLGEEKKQLTEGQSIYGCNFAVRKNVLFELGGFHPDSFSDPDKFWHRGDGETGLLLKAYKVGIGVVYEPRAWLYHVIPSERLSVQYMMKRSRAQALSDGFTFYREYIPSKFALSLQSFTFVVYLIRRAISYLIFIFWERRNKQVVRCSYWLMRIFYNLKLITDEEFRHYVSKESFFE